MQKPIQQHIQQPAYPPQPPLSPLRIALLRVLYGVIFLGNAAMTLPELLFPESQHADSHSVVTSMLGALMLLALLGLRYPVKMLPVLLWELTWRSIWLFNFAFRMWLGPGLDAYAQDVAIAVLFGLILVPLLLPWGYLYQTYGVQKGEPWLGRRLSSTEKHHE